MSIPVRQRTDMSMLSERSGTLPCNSRHLLSAKGQCAMKQDAIPPPVAPATLQDVADRLASDADLSEIRKRDLRSAVRTYGKLLDRPLSAIAIDPAELRRALDRMVPAQAKVSRKRWANLRSDL